MTAGARQDQQLWSHLIIIDWFQELIEKCLLRQQPPLCPPNRQIYPNVRDHNKLLHLPSMSKHQVVSPNWLDTSNFHRMATIILMHWLMQTNGSGRFGDNNDVLGTCHAGESSKICGGNRLMHDMTVQHWLRSANKGQILIWVLPVGQGTELNPVEWWV